MQIEIKNGRLIDPKNTVDRENTSLFIANGKIAGVGSAPAGFVADEVIDASVSPALLGVARALDQDL